MEQTPTAPVFVTKWDGVNVWIDWPARSWPGGLDAVVLLQRPETGERHECAVRLPCQLPAVFPVLRCEVLADGDSDFLPAVIADFDPAMGALFELESEAGAVLDAGTCIAAIVRDRALAFRLTESITLPPGEPFAAWAVANREDGYHQLRAPREFSCEDGGFQVHNITETRNHYLVRPGNPSAGVIEPIPYQAPLVVAFSTTPPNPVISRE